MGINCSAASPLSEKQNVVWSLILRGLSVSAIAEKMSTTRQYVNQTRLTAEAKLSNTLLEIARVNDLQVSKVHAREGILIGYHPALNRKAIITYNATYGIKLWYWHDKPEEVTNKQFLNQTKEYLLALARERGIAIKDSGIHPAKLAHDIFGQLAPELRQ
jgi:DNA-binding CsgD family transcriptional regulator